MRYLLILYVVGILAALWRTDAGWSGRVALALAWPLGPLAFAVTVATLLAAALIAFPAFGVAVAAIVLLSWWVL